MLRKISTRLQSQTRQQGFVTMIVIMVLIVSAIIYLAYTRVASR